LGALAAWINPLLPHGLKIPQKWIGKEPAMVLFKKSVQENISNLRFQDLNTLVNLQKNCEKLEKILQKVLISSPDLFRQFPELWEMKDSISDMKDTILSEKKHYQETQNINAQKQFWHKSNISKPTPNKRTTYPTNVPKPKVSLKKVTTRQNISSKNIPSKKRSTKSRLTEKEYKNIINPGDYVRVKGHYRNGKWVKPYFRKKPNR
jgi:hypothetical protein